MKKSKPKPKVSKEPRVVSNPTNPFADAPTEEEISRQEAARLMAAMLDPDGIMLVQRCKVPGRIKKVRAIIMQDLEIHVLGDCALIQPRVSQARGDQVVIDMNQLQQVAAPQAPRSPQVAWRRKARR